MGVTVNEWINRSRYEYIREVYGVHISDFSRGFSNNIKTFFCGKASSTLVYNVSENPSEYITNFKSDYPSVTKLI